MQEFRQHLEKATKGAFSRCVVEAFLVSCFAILRMVATGGVCPRL